MDSPVSDTEVYQLGPFIIKVKENVITGENGDQVLLPKVMALLVYLCQRGQQVVTFDELVGAIWPTEVVGDNAIYNLVGQLRKALGDSATKPTYIQTVSKVGYRLLLPAEPVSPAIENQEHVDTPESTVAYTNEPTNRKGSLANAVNWPTRTILGWLALTFIAIGIVGFWPSHDEPSAQAQRDLQLAYYQLYRGDTQGVEQAIDVLQQISTTEPNWATPKLELAYSFIRMAKAQPTQRDFWLAKAQAISQAPALTNHGQRLIALLQTPANSSLNDDLSELFVGSAPLVSERLAYSDWLFVKGELELAEKQAQLALVQCSNCPYVYRKVATAQVVRGQVEDGFANFNRYRMLLNKNSLNPTDNAGYVPLNRQNLSDMAKWHFASVLPEPLLDHQRNTLALFYLTLNRIDLAENIVNTTPQSSSQFFDLYTHAAIAGAKGDIQSSYQLLVKRQAMYPNNPRFKLSLVYALWQLGQYEAALEAFEQYGLPPHNNSLPGHLPFEIYSVYAALLLKTGDEPTGQDILSRLTEQLRAGFTPGSDNADIRLASVLALQGKHDDAIHQLELAISQGWVSDFNQNWWNIQDSPYFKGLVTNPEFQKVINDYFSVISAIEYDTQSH